MNNIKKLLLLLLIGICVQINAQSYSIIYNEIKIFDTISKQYNFEGKTSTRVLIDYNANTIVIDNDSLQKFLKIVSNRKVNEDVFYDCRDKDQKVFKIDILNTPTHYALVESSGKTIITYRAKK